MELSGKENLVKRLKGATAILMPLILSSMERIEVVSNAMELRCFGKERRRTWYRERRFTGFDYATMVLGFVLIGISIALQFLNGGRYWNPF